MAQRRPQKPQKLVLKLEEWPEAHQKLWNDGLEEGDPFDDPRYASGLSETTIRNAKRGYGAWLHVQIAADSFDPASSPADGVTPAAVRRFRDALLARGNTDNTLVTRFYDLQAALRIMQPEGDFSWLTTPGGLSLRRHLQPTPKGKKFVTATELLKWSHTLLETASQRRTIELCLTQYRNGLIVGMFTYLAPRLRSISLLQINKHLVKRSEGYRVVLKAEDNKTKREEINYLVPSDLMPFLTHYLEKIRPRLLGTARHDWLWVNADGSPFGQRGIEGMIWRGSERHLGRKLGPHHFRHALASTAAEKLPDFPGLAATILAASPRVVEGHYNRARQQQTITTYLEHVRSERSETPRASPNRSSRSLPSRRGTRSMDKCPEQGMLPLFDGLD